MMKNYFSIKLMIIIAAVSAFWGCAAVGPDYTKPLSDLPAQWNNLLQKGDANETGDPQSLAQWWKTLNDPVLTDIISQAVAGNQDLKLAMSRIREARAQWGISESDRFPSLDASGSLTSSKSTGSEDRNERYSLGIDAGWEADIFGKVRRSSEAAYADYEAVTENYRDVLITLIAETALNYIDVRTYQKQIEVAEENLKIRMETYQLTNYRFKSGLSSALDMNSAKYNVEENRASITVTQRSLDAAKNRIAVLLGKAPGAVHEKLSQTKNIPVPGLKIAAGIPADILRRRPDIRKAERELAAQTARIGVAEADLYPRLTLSGSIGLEAVSLGDLFTADAVTDSIGPRISWKIFDAGAIRRNIEIQNVRQEQALIKYESAILSALEEVENALYSYAKEQSRRKSLLNASKAAQQAVNLSLNQYNSGLKDFQTVLESQRALLSFKDQLARSEANIITYLIKLYKALGGGWNLITFNR
ncbi:Efflux transporter, RND family [Desulfonema limicola]|uniref:Efflux transporter, RND family n=1 Tax=Desulfonema limicola TaxID=45656 RepID=A0A975GI92_9BACT|nr:efflux transporter outer membrane subunit [Desulfonema limicola]QTA82287.1 Efflux transporter, RND family [Desulfonema limicola]